MTVICIDPLTFSESTASTFTVPVRLHAFAVALHANLLFAPGGGNQSSACRTCLVSSPSIETLVEIILRQAALADRALCAVSPPLHGFHLGALFRRKPAEHLHRESAACRWSGPFNVVCHWPGFTSSGWKSAAQSVEQASIVSPIEILWSWNPPFPQSSILAENWRAWGHPYRLHLNLQDSNDFSGSPIGIAGAGRVAQALGRLLAAQGEPVAVIASRSIEHARVAAAFIGPGVRAVSYPELAQNAGRILIAVSDSAIESVAAVLDMQAGIVLHTCGNCGPEALRGPERARLPRSHSSVTNDFRSGDRRGGAPWRGFCHFWRCLGDGMGRTDCVRCERTNLKNSR